ncbi:hypothetical protein HPB47_019406 [Ixodes persulcatus]|uniref:Uncharacterized protein n=1 Tax=Ixodes persulcatus TaxID=34615 RepID=A0AC60QK52_IXOPE|nr:hypothetical protein HPB47_019406 [Ixodes persulcatus]
MSATRSTQACFEALPNEILFRIFYSLDAKFVVSVVSKVCTRFSAVLSDSSFWQQKLFLRWPKKYPVAPDNESVDWKETCLERERQFEQWTDWENKMEKITVLDPHEGTLNSVLLIDKGSVCATTSRDHDLHIWDVRERTGAPESCSRQERLVHSVVDAHAGWLWSLHSVDGVLITSSFDSTVKFWDLDHALQCLGSFKFRSIVLSICDADGLLYFGTFDGTVYCHDPREGKEPTPRYSHGTGCVTCLAADGRSLVAGCDSHWLRVFDQRARRLRQQIKFASHPSALSFDSRQLWVGSKGGGVHIMDMTTGHAKELQCVSVDVGVGRSQVSTGIYHSLSSVLVSYMGGPILVLEPNLDPEVISKGVVGQAVSRFHVSDRTLATVGADLLEVWRPRFLE